MSLRIRTCSFLAALLVLAACRTPAQEEEANSTFVNFNYDQVEIRILARTVGLATGKRFVLDESVVGKVTVVTPERVHVDEVYPLFLSILESSGFSVVERDTVFHVVKLAEALSPVGPIIGPLDTAGSAGIVTKIIKLHHLNAIEMKKALESMVRGAREGALAAVGSTNHLIITDTADSVRRIEKIIEELDLPGSARRVEVLPLEFASASDVAAQLLVAMQGSEGAGQAYADQIRQVTGGGGALPASFTVVASPEANRLVLVGTPVQLEEAQRIVAELDVEGPSGSGRLHAIFLNYIEATEAAENLNALLAKTAAKDAQQQIAIEPNISNNALIVDASARDFEFVKSLVDELDQVPQQVMVEILIAEVTLGDTLDVGVEFLTADETMEGRNLVFGRTRPGETDELLSLVTDNIFPQGLTVGVARGEPITVGGVTIPDIPVLVTALAEDRNVQILSNPSLVAQNNKEASVSVVENIPILSSTIEGGSGTARDVIQNIERLDVGIKLNFTPHVNPGGEVLMDLNPSIEAIVDEGTPDQPFTPTIARREIKTTVTVPDGETVVISGLIREDQIDTVSKVPLLGDIPFLGHLFRRTQKQKQRTNLLVMVTPHVVTDPVEAQRLRQELEKRTGLGGVSNILYNAETTGE